MLVRNTVVGIASCSIQYLWARLPFLLGQNASSASSFCQQIPQGVGGVYLGSIVPVGAIANVEVINLHFRCLDRLPVLYEEILFCKNIASDVS